MKSILNLPTNRALGFVITIFGNCLCFSIAATFSNPGRILINDARPGTPYPSEIQVNGITNRVGSVGVTLYGFSHDSPVDVSILLVGPSSRNLLLMAHAGSDITTRNVQLTFDDSAPAAVPSFVQIVSGTFKPTQISPTPAFPLPAPAGTYGTTLSVFSNAEPVGVWSLFVLDNIPLYSGVITGGWSLTITTLLAPQILVQPLSTTVETGSALDLDVRAIGEPPPTYQWFLNGTIRLSGCTNSALRLPNVQFDQAGTYSVSVSNASGAVTSAPAEVGVIPRVERKLVPALTLKGQPGTVLNLEFAPAVGLASKWTTFDNVPLTQAAQWYFDLTASPPSQGFYRAWQSGGLGQPPVLNLNMVPALTLTGAIGNSVRVDCINQFGPIDAWVNLATVALTDTSQLYFDTSVIGQPPRLWRIVPVP